jgi:hypothetical protein
MSGLVWNPWRPPTHWVRSRADFCETEHAQDARLSRADGGPLVGRVRVETRGDVFASERGRGRRGPVPSLGGHAAKEVQA